MARFLRKQSWAVLEGRWGSGIYRCFCPGGKRTARLRAAVAASGLTLRKERSTARNMIPTAYPTCRTTTATSALSRGARRALRRDAHYRDDHGAQQNQHEKRKPHERAAECAKRKESNPDPVHLSGSPVLSTNP